MRRSVRVWRNGLELQALDPNRSTAVVVAKARQARRNKDAFVKLKLEPGWQLERRAYQGRTLSHVYFANNESLNHLLSPKADSQLLRPQFVPQNLFGRSHLTAQFFPSTGRWGGVARSSFSLVTR